MRPNFVNVVLDQNNIQPGKQVTGKVYVGVYSAENANVQVEIQGMEMCKFIYYTTEYYYVDAPARPNRVNPNGPQRPSHGNAKPRKIRKSRRIPHKTNNSYKVFYQKQDLTPGFLGPGEYTFPFTFMVPASAPSSFYWKHDEDHEAKISYGVNATYGRASDLEEMIVQQHIPEKYGASHVSTNNEITCCCCCGKGQVAISTTFEKDNYRPGEMVKVQAAVDNTKSKVNLRSVNAIATCYVIMYSKGKSCKRSVECGKVTAQGVSEGQGSMGAIPLTFQLNVNQSMPTVMGRIVRAEFILKVVTPVSGFCICSKTPQTALPIIVHHTPKPPKKFVPPPNFAPQQMEPKSFNISEEPNPPPMQYNPGQMYNPYRQQPVIVQPVIIQQVPVVQPVYVQPVAVQPAMVQQPVMVPQQPGMVQPNQIKMAKQ